MAEAASALRAVDVRVEIGGVVALDGVSIEVGAAEVVGLIGSNGAGKTTLLDVVSGHRRGPLGRVEVFGRDVSGVPPARRARLGVGRTYQDGRLFPGLTVREAVRLGLARGEAAGFTAAIVGAPWARFHERSLRARADAVIQSFGLAPWAGTLLGSLSTGTRRACDLAIQTAAGLRLLLLDEPTAGLAQREVEEVARVLHHVRDLGCAILVVEHDIPLMMRLVDRLYALDQGRVIAEGTPDDISRDPAVIAAYLGSMSTAPASRRAARRR